MNNTYIVCTSHRSREKLFRIIPDKTGYYAIKNNNFTGEDIYNIPENLFNDVIQITGIKRFTAKNKKIYKRW